MFCGDDFVSLKFFLSLKVQEMERALVFIDNRKNWDFFDSIDRVCALFI